MRTWLYVYSSRMCQATYLPWLLAIGIGVGTLDGADRAGVSRVKPVPGNVVELLKDAKSLPKFDLIVAGGLFDYLEDRVARFVIKSAYYCLRPGGRFFFTNIGRNPYRPWMEY